MNDIIGHPLAEDSEAERGRGRRRIEILVADDDDAIRRLLEHNLRMAGYAPVLAADGREAIARGSAELSCALVDLKMPYADGLAVLRHLKEQHPDLPVIMISAIGQVREAVQAVKQGAFEFIAKPFNLDELLVAVRAALQLNRALRENRELRESVSMPGGVETLVGKSRQAEALRDSIRRLGERELSVVLTGESGVGKGLVARLIHRASKRANKAFVTTSCPALPSELLETEMFGHERGAFTGAIQRRIGRFEMAQGGTLFLDEISDLPLPLQAKLLNVLQDRQFQRVGGSEMLPTNIRLIAATNADLEDKVQRREFRSDLWYRINVVPLHIPPLRERAEDVPLLAEQILARQALLAAGQPLILTPGAQEALVRYAWPGNVRQLQNVLERAAAFCSGNEIRPDDLPEEVTRVRNPPPIDPNKTGTPNVAGWTLEEVKILCLLQTLALCKNNKAETARRLGVAEKTVYNMLSSIEDPGANPRAAAA